MKYTNTKTFYTRTILIPTLAVAAFVFYCASQTGVNADSLSSNIENTMQTSIYVEEQPQDILAFIPATKPANTFDVASK